MMDIKNAIEIISNVIECEIEYSEDADSVVYAADLKIALQKIQDFINESIE